MATYYQNAKVTVPALDIKRNKADVVAGHPKRFHVWWNLSDNTNHEFKDPDMTVPNQMIILESGTQRTPGA